MTVHKKQLACLALLAAVGLAFVSLRILPRALAGAEGDSRRSTAQARQSAKPLDFKRDIEPLFEKHCHRCHGADQQKSGYRLDDKDAAFQGGDSGEAAIVAGDADNSPLVQYIRGDDPDFVMPPEGERLTEAEVKRVVQWIEDGATWNK